MNFVTKSSDERTILGKEYLGKFRARYYEKKNPTKNGYFVKDLDIVEVMSVKEKKIVCASKINEKNNWKRIVCVKIKLKNEEGPYCLSFKF